MMQILFEMLIVPTMYVPIQTFLSLYASGRTTGWIRLVTTLFSIWRTSSLSERTKASGAYKEGADLQLERVNVC